MESKEFEFKGLVVNGFLMLLIILLLFVFPFVLNSIFQDSKPLPLVGMTCLIVLNVLSYVCAIFSLFGFFILQPNEKRVMVFFGKYKGTFSKTGFFWVNPFIQKKPLSVRVRNLDIAPLKVNDKVGNPVMIGMVLVWRLRDSYKALFEIDAQSSNISTKASLVQFYTQFVRVQADAALRQVAGLYAYDTMEEQDAELTLRDGGDVINNQLETELNARLLLAGIEVIEARLNYLAYAPEIAQVMLRRQQAVAIIAAREKIVEGAVSMVKLAIDQLEEKKVVAMDDDKKAALASNLMVVLCADESAQPIINTGDSI